jgi:precorrin-3B synthase
MPRYVWAVTSVDDDLTAAPPSSGGVARGIVGAMESADGWLVRLRLPGGAVTAGQLGVVAEVAARFGSRVVEITSRANVQIRGIAAESLNSAADLLVDARLAEVDGALDARRGIVCSPLAGHDPTEAVDPQPYARAIANALRGAVFVDELPPKFCVVIDGGGEIGVRAVTADIAIGATRTRTSLRSWTIAVGGSVRKGVRWAAPSVMDPAIAANAVLAVAQACTVFGCRAQELPAHLLDGMLPRLGGQPSGPRLDVHRSNNRVAVGVFDDVDSRRCNVIAGARLGRLDAAVLPAIAGFAATAIAIRFTPSGGIALLGVPRAHAGEIARRLGSLGLSLDATDAMHTVAACVGAPGCASSRADTLAAADAIIGARQRSGRDLRRVHLSGCDRACGAAPDASLIIADEAGNFDVDPTVRRR